MALTIHGYRVPKQEIEDLPQLKARLTVKPYVPAVFVNPRFVQKYPVFKESPEYMYVPKHFGIGEFGPYKTTTRTVTPTSDTFWEFTGLLRDIQVDVVNSFLKPEPRDGLICLQTGGGKTVCGLYIAAQLKVPTLVLVHNTFLRDQWIERIKSFLPNARIGLRNEDTTLDTFIQEFIIRVDGDVVKYKHDIHTPNFKLLKNMKPNEVERLSSIMKVENSIQSIQNHIKEYTSVRDVTIAMLQGVMRDNVDPGDFKNIGFVIVDECHHIASEAFSQSVPKITSKYMLGLSATPERKDRLMYVIHWFLGPLLYKSDTSDKVDPGVFVEVYEFEGGDDKFNEVIYNNQGVMFTSLMINKLVDYEPRNKMITELLTDIYEDESRQMLVLSDRVDHCQTLYDMLPPAIKETACVLSRKIDSKTRSEWCETKRILIATYQMCKEGFDVATLNTLIIATPRPDVDQIVGRILRVEKTKRTVSPLIIDIVDPAFRRQFQERLSLYNKRSYNVEKMKLN